MEKKYIDETRQGEAYAIADLDGNTKKNSDDDISSSQEESLDGNTINDSDDDISLPQEENKIREPDFHSKDSIQ